MFQGSSKLSYFQGLGTVTLIYDFKKIYEVILKKAISIKSVKQSSIKNIILIKSILMNTFNLIKHL